MTRLAPPPLSPNCVSSRAKPTDWLHYIQPLTHTTLDRIRSVVTAMPRTEVIEQTDAYLHVVFTTALCTRPARAAGSDISSDGWRA